MIQVLKNVCRGLIGFVEAESLLRNVEPLFSGFVSSVCGKNGSFGRDWANVSGMKAFALDKSFANR